MIMTINGSRLIEAAILPIEAQLDNVHGLTINNAQWNSAQWWQGQSGTPGPGPGFDPAVWNITDNSLPTLKNTGGNQNPQIK